MIQLQEYQHTVRIVGIKTNRHPASPQKITIRVLVVKRPHIQVDGLKGLYPPLLVPRSDFAVQPLHLPPQPPREKVGELEEGQQREPDAEANLSAVGA